MSYAEQMNDAREPRVLNAFPLTPLANDSVDEPAFAALIERLSEAGVGAITALGSTGAGAYLGRAERARVASLAVAHAGGVPVSIGVGALRTSEVLANISAAEQAGASGILISPMSYLPLTADEVFELLRAAAERSSLPVTVYDNPVTTHFRFTPDLYARIGEIPGIAAVKIPPVPNDLAGARARILEVRSVLPAGIELGVSGDAVAAYGLLAGCDTWHSVIGGTLPALAIRLAALATHGGAADAVAESERLAPLWALNAEHGSLRVVAAVAEHLGLAPPDCLPLPVRGLGREARAALASIVDDLGLAE